MAFNDHRDFAVWQLAEEFKAGVFALVADSPEVQRAWRFRDQLIESARAPANDFVEGFRRRSPRTLIQYLTYGLSSLNEAEGHLRDGVALRYFPASATVPLHRLAARTTSAISGLQRQQRRYIAEQARLKRAEASHRRRKPKPQP